MIRNVFTRRLSLLSLAVVIGATAAMFAGTARATLLWYDGFSLTGDGGDYLVDTPLARPADPGDPMADPPIPPTPAIAQSGGSGTFFTGPWQPQAGNDHLVLGSSLTRPGQINPSIGGSAGDNDTDGCCITARDARLFASPWGGFTDPDGTFYFGFLATFGTGTLHHRVLEMWSGDQTDDGNRNLQLGYSEFTGVGPNTMSMSVHDSSDDSNQNATLSENVNFISDQGTTHYIVLKFDMSTSGNDVVSAFLDPVGMTEPATPSAQISVGQFLADRFGAISTFVFGPGTAPVMDELRVGDMFADVANNTRPYVAVPEPTSVLLFGLGALGLTLRRRK